MKLIRLFALASCLLSCLAATDTVIQPYCTHDLRAMGFPIPPQTSDFIGVYSTGGLDKDSSYRVVLTYRIGGTPAISSTVDVIANETGVFASFPVNEAKDVSIIGASIRKI